MLTNFSVINSLDGNHTPMPSPTHMQQMSDSSRSPPPAAMSPTQSRKRRKERKSERGKKNSDRHKNDRSDREGVSKRLPLMMINAEPNWDEVMLEHQRLQQQFLAETCGNFAEDSDPNDNDNGQGRVGYNQFLAQLENYNNDSNLSNSGVSKINNINSLDDGGASDSMMSSLHQRSPSPQIDSDTGKNLVLQLFLFLRFVDITNVIDL